MSLNPKVMARVFSMADWSMAQKRWNELIRHGREKAMSRAEEFLHVIRDDPNDYVTRLVFADWLEEHGDPRAELFRLYCEMASLPRDDPRRKTLRDRIVALQWNWQWGAPP